MSRSMDEIAFFIGNPICLIFQSATLDEGFNHCCVSLNKMTSQEFFLLEKCRVSNPDKKKELANITHMTCCSSKGNDRCLLVVTSHSLDGEQVRSQSIKQRISSSDKHFQCPLLLLSLSPLPKAEMGFLLLNMVMAR
jgi:hypothetical protein